MSTLGTIVIAGLSGLSLLQDSSRLDAILERGEIVVGTTGDYRPFSYRLADGSFEGLDIDAAHALGETLGVTVRFVQTSWPRLVEGIQTGRYDIAMSGITRTLERQKVVDLTEPYWTLGKCPLIRRSDRDRFPDFAAVDREGVRIGVNPGGTNESFVRKHIERATIVVIEDNLSIPSAVASSIVDVMITDNVEAVLVSGENDALLAVSPDQPLNHDELSYMIARDDRVFLRWLNLWIHRLAVEGQIERWRRKWIPSTPASPRIERDGSAPRARHRLRRGSRAQRAYP